MSSGSPPSFPFFFFFCFFFLFFVFPSSLPLLLPTWSDQKDEGCRGMKVRRALLSPFLPPSLFFFFFLPGRVKHVRLGGNVVRGRTRLLPFFLPSLFPLSPLFSTTERRGRIRSGINWCFFFFSFFFSFPPSSVRITS